MMTSMTSLNGVRRDFPQKMEKIDTAAKKERPQRDGATLGHLHETGVIAAEVGKSGVHGHGAGTEKESRGLARVQEASIVIVVEAAVKAGSVRRGLRKCAERVVASLLALCLSGEGTLLWMHRRHWPEDWSELRNYKSKRKRRCLRNSNSKR